MAPKLLAGAAVLSVCAQFGAVEGNGAAMPTFEAYLQEHGLQYRGPELDTRKGTFEAAVKNIETHNADKKNSWKMGLNKFTLLSEQEMAPNFGYMKQPGGKAPTRDISPPKKAEDFPESFDWRDHRPIVVTAVKNQGSCGSCWAFAATAVLESAVALQTGALFDFSPQQITSCMPNPEECGGAGGCQGATAQLAFNYTIRKGMTSLWTWPYTSGIWKNNGECFEMTGKKAARAGITGYHQLPQNDADALIASVQVNPVSVSVAASGWGLYSSGVFDGCSQQNPIINHAVVLMGYGNEYGKSYWLIRNSWGPTWGEFGYIRLQRFPGNEPCGDDTDPLMGYSCKATAPESIRVCGMCGVLADSAYPTGAFLGAPQDPDDPALHLVSDAELFHAGIAEAQAGPSAAAAAAVAALLAVAAAVPVAWRRVTAVRSSYAEVGLVVADA
mmetsp:Transcript_41892/g.135592  ORF Transcript_41892/g.135592 Transcript_41892/m.135592 type:complete len:443 (+) Transcript_41892:74-1402(+)